MQMKMGVVAMVIVLLSTLIMPSLAQDSKMSAKKKKIIIGVSVAGYCLACYIIFGLYLYIRHRRSESSLKKFMQSRANDLNDAEKETTVENYSQEVTQNETATIPVDQAPKPVVPTRSGTNKASFMTRESLQYEFAELEAATDNFSNDNKIGRGGFGIVYKGTLPNGQKIAVKRLSNGSSQGEKEFETEVVLLAKLQHRNLVRLLGFCLADGEALLVYEFVTNKSLDYFLFDSNKRKALNWPCRFEIIKGIARGIMYLHEDSPIRTMHRDLKAANILLDAKMYPKIADFGVARICDIEQTHINPTRVVGTHGYMAPEYLFHGKFSTKSDVYAMGVLFLEIISGRRINNFSSNESEDENLLSCAWRCWEDEKPLEIMDPMLRESFSRDEVVKCVQMGLLCVQEDSKLRPTMSTIVHILNSSSGIVALSIPQHPAFMYSGSSHLSTTKSNTTDSTH